MLRTLGATLAAALALTGLAASAGADRSPATTTMTLTAATPTPTPTFACPPALPVTGQVTGATTTSVTITYWMVLSPPCGYDPPLLVSLFASREDATAWRDPVAEAVTGPERSGKVTIDGLTPGTEYWFRFGDTKGGRDPYVIGGPARTLSLCSATATIDSRWGSGFVATVTVRNDGAEPVPSWLVSWRWSGDERIQSIWGGVAEGAGQDVAVRNASWNGTLAPGASTTFGLLVAAGVTPAAITPVCGR
ncbi:MULTISPECIES: cellulose binding domain-containing protein [unclassified Micromonospora]|uniref:cellulose binding domain-containing protein n=1 Tax=unclassified Micromonospora TaxID=2617518 RepID=UPI001B39AE25|nr:MULTISPECIES: cellulose binding domain-containing protein [unclassified Micromonospora]MBQ1046407.1 cellulose binding domain-containing protein [Micromonospora sp. C72]MBQ1058940.1 cellulose binding domain-containing protein [Micromonospora sp. C32]